MADPATRSRVVEVPALTGLRGVAALWVLLFHAWIVGGREKLGGLEAWFNFGWLGVDLFFGLSAFLLTQHALARRASTEGGGPTHALGEPYADYLRRRILRVFPAYYACLSILLALSAAGHHGPFPSVADVALHLPMLHSLNPHFMESINGVFWSLPFEWQFYLVLPVLLVVLVRIGGAAFFLVAAAIAIGAYLLAGYFLAPFPLAQLTGRIDNFAIGMACALYVSRASLTRRLATLAWLAGFALLFAVPALFTHAPEGFRPGGWVGLTRTLAIDVAVGLVLIGLASGEPLGRRVLGNRPLYALGVISYSIYLFHLPVLLLLAEAGAYSYGRSGVLQVLAFALPATVLVSAISYRLFEAPFQNAGRQAARATTAMARWQPVLIVVGWGAAILAATMLWNARA